MSTQYILFVPSQLLSNILLDFRLRISNTLAFLKERLIFGLRLNVLKYFEGFNLKCSLKTYLLVWVEFVIFHSHKPTGNIKALY